MRAALFTLPALLVAVPAGTARAGFRVQEIGKDLNVVYAVAIADMNRDKKPDVVAINNTQAIWWQNPTWEKHVVFDGPSSGHPFWKKDNVCFALEDIDGDGALDMALGADWQPSNTTGGGSLQWLGRNKKDPKAPWELHPLSQEPTLHRMRWADVDGDGKRELVVKALHGRGTKAPGWDGAGLRVLVFRKPKDPVNDPWLVEVADDKLHIGHNFMVLEEPRRPATLLVAAKEGAWALARAKDGTWSRAQVGEGAPGEIKMGRVRGERHLVAVEPWHGTSVVVYKDPGGPLGKALWARDVIDENLTELHGVGWGDFDGDGHDEIVAGWRKKPWGMATYKKGADGKWQKTPLDDGMATEDIAVADLDGDGRPEIVAGGRATSNVRIYWNEKN
jgi:hypothetical protein